MFANSGLTTLGYIIIGAARAPFKGEEDMTILIIGLVVFLGLHSVRIVADPLRSEMIARIGERRWKGLYALASLAGFALIVWGYSIARLGSPVVWQPPAWTWTITSMLLLPSLVLIVAGNMRGTRIKAALGHPMLLGTQLWAFAHLLSNGRASGLLLFGSFLVWAIADYRASRRRDAAKGVTYPPGSGSRDVTAIVIGVIAWAVFGFSLHGPLIGVRPFG